MAGPVSAAWPLLREELTLYPGPPDRLSGAPTWSLHDPVRNQFFRIDWLTFEILSRWERQDPGAIIAAIAAETPIRARTADIEAVIRFLVENELIQRHAAGSARWYRDAQERRRTGPGTWLLHHYLSIRIPLLRPDTWLTRTAFLARPFFSPIFLWLTLAVLAFSLVEVSRQWDRFATMFVDTFSLEGLASYYLVLIFVKILHELGHAYTAKRFGCKVPTMGVAFIVLFPMAYTDVNDAWKLASRRQRLAVGAAGILTELAVAVWASLAWVLLPDGVLRGAAFFLATTTWIYTVNINASPFMRFDGYFLLMDWLDLPNLHQRAFALARWRLREGLFGLGLPVPEVFPPRRHRFLLIFAYLTWLYRLVVFGGIALLVYYVFPKPLGPFLAAVELGWFILLPVWRELKCWQAIGVARMQPQRLAVVSIVLLLGLLVLLVPWDRRVHAQALLRPARFFPLVAPGPSSIRQIDAVDGMAVQPGQTLFQLASPELHFQKRQLDARGAVLAWQAATAGVDPRLRERQQVIAAAREKLGAELTGVGEAEGRYTLSAPLAGRFYFSHPDYQPGNWVKKNEQLGVVADDGGWVVETYLAEADLHRVRVGDRGRFFSDTPDAAILTLRVTGIDHDATRIQQDGLLASTHGGRILTRHSEQGLVPERVIYRLTLEPDGPFIPPEPRILRGRLVLFGEPKSYVEELVRSAAGLFVREANF